MNKQQLIADLQSNSELGIAFNQSGIALQVMDFKEFLRWYDDTGHSRYTIDTPCEENSNGDWILVERSAADSRKIFSRTPYTSEELANDAYYTVLECKYNDDNGAGGIFYTNAEALSRLEDDSDEWQSIFPKEEIEETED